MAPRPAVDKLPEPIRIELDEKLVRNGFGDYLGLSAWLAEQGYQIGPKAVWNHGHKLKASIEKSVNRARARLEGFRALGGVSDEEKAMLMEANEIVAMDQILDLFEEMDGMEVTDRIAAIPKLVRASTDLNRGAIGSAKWKKEFEAEARRLAREEAAQTAAETAKRNGLSADVVDAIKREILGVA
ncbi:MAG: DUF3486 family protein [Methylobacter sp.]|uniref:phage protein Gp27 family protein n=1 Tax=Methylobacter sp. TaxID=2051955 RepID=UPI00258D7274|nr:phage protein Gp27 family protein [Methylobacter sp.]MCL7420848.1 DUF3486 family protein [Methylobacter sp.]